MRGGAPSRARMASGVCSCSMSDADHAFQLLFPQDDDGRAFYLDDLLSLEIAEQACDGLARRPDHLRDLLVRQQDLQPDAFRRRLAVLRAPVEEELPEFLAGRLRQAEGADLTLGGLVLLAELLRGMHARLGVRVEKAEEVLALDEIELRRLERLRADFVRAAEDRRA